ncbi:hypothetical protein P5V15_013008 [Pogonomyrmex californicus]
MTHFHRDSFGGTHVASKFLGRHGASGSVRMAWNVTWLCASFPVPKVTGMERERSQRRATRPRPNHAMSTFTTHQALSLPLRVVRDAESRERCRGMIATARFATVAVFPVAKLVVAFNGADTGPARRAESDDYATRSRFTLESAVRSYRDRSGRALHFSFSLSLSLSLSLSHSLFLFLLHSLFLSPPGYASAKPDVYTSE